MREEGQGLNRRVYLSKEEILQYYEENKRKYSEDEARQFALNYLHMTHIAGFEGTEEEYHELERYLKGYEQGRKDINKAESLIVYRLKNELTQSELAEKSGVKLRTIQEYEQGRKDINKAEALTVYKLSKCLGCRMEDLLEI